LRCKEPTIRFSHGCARDSSRTAALEGANFGLDLDQAAMQISVPLIAALVAGGQLLQAPHSANVSEDLLALGAQRIAEHLANIIDRQRSGAAPDPLEYPIFEIASATKYTIFEIASASADHRTPSSRRTSAIRSER
jgi:hypothetical protein